MTRASIIPIDSWFIRDIKREGERVRERQRDRETERGDIERERQIERERESESDRVSERQIDRHRAEIIQRSKFV